MSRGQSTVVGVAKHRSLRVREESKSKTANGDALVPTVLAHNVPEFDVFPGEDASTGLALDHASERALGRGGELAGHRSRGALCSVRGGGFWTCFRDVAVRMLGELRVLCAILHRISP